MTVRGLSFVFSCCSTAHCYLAGLPSVIALDFWLTSSDAARLVCRFSWQQRALLCLSCVFLQHALFFAPSGGNASCLLSFVFLQHALFSHLPAAMSPVFILFAAVANPVAPKFMGGGKLCVTIVDVPFSSRFFLVVWVHTQ